ncbi:uroporphyrin-III C-methyltransferase (uroporphyrinogen III methylase) [Pedobacter sp. BAL39]|nr:uroporphyrin-III C-methyltransferase (uroporphyrinogen III methylase) [Pedobacter sp. BAL39]
MKLKNNETELFIIGGGPGDPELLTIKAFKILKKAQVILYDNLSNKKLLDIAKKTCKMIYVGKQPYGICTPQEKINELIVENAKKYQIVVRLKGGDPFIFGRGFEELLFAEAYGIKAQYVPGISSMQGAGFVDIPLTHRGISESLWIITGTKKDGSLSADLKCAMQSSATVVIYMGMKKLREISDAYQQSGLGSTPAAIVQHATMPHQQHVVCNVKDLFEIATSANLSHPAIIIIGDVVKAREILLAQHLCQGRIAV